jgi:hypothetical protein
MVDAKKFSVPDIQPFGFIIEILDDEQKPVSGVGFSVYIDGVGMSAETDEEGIIKVPRPRSEIKLSLAGEEVSAATEEPAKAPEEVETAAPLESQEATPMAGEPASTPSGTTAETTLSGKGWVSKFPGSKSLDDLDGIFKDAVGKFISALKAASADVTINATKRPRERAYLMHWSWKIVKENHDASKIPSYEGVDINWWHGDQAKSNAAAQEMVDGYGIDKLKIAPSLTSRHIEGKAIDMNISWSGDLKIKKNDGSEVTITTSPRDGTNSELIKVGATYDVIHFKNVAKDKPHWSTDGK